MPRHHKSLVFVSIILFITSKTLQIFKNIVAGTPYENNNLYHLTPIATFPILLWHSRLCGCMGKVGFAP